MDQNQTNAKLPRVTFQHLTTHEFPSIHQSSRNSIQLEHQPSNPVATTPEWNQMTSPVNSDHENYSGVDNTAITGYLSGHSVDNHPTHFRSPAFIFFSSKRELFLLQRQMLYDMGILSEENQPISSLGYQDISSIPTRTIDFESLGAIKMDIKQLPKRFVIFQQPDPIQRRSYATEKRFLSPKPIVICAIDILEDSNSNTRPKIVEGTVSVELAYEDNNRNVDEMKYLPHLLQSNDGTTKRIIENIAEFELSVMATSGAKKFVLVFRVEYKTESGETMEEFLVSSPFEVVANVSKMKSQATKTNRHKRPRIQGLVPTEGSADAETEVWIKGSHFSPQVEVTFSTVPAKVVSIEDNLLTVLAPKFPEVNGDTEVTVSVSNVTSKSRYPAEETLMFKYFAGDRIAQLRRTAKTQMELSGTT